MEQSTPISCRKSVFPTTNSGVESNYVLDNTQYPIGYGYYIPHTLILDRKKKQKLSFDAPPTPSTYYPNKEKNSGCSLYNVMLLLTSISIVSKTTIVSTLFSFEEEMY